MSKKKLVIVESPTKAKTIRKFLGPDYTVESCMGHVRDLPTDATEIPKEYQKKPWKNLGINVEDNFKPIYCIPESKRKVVKDLKSKVKEAKEIILATDEDREGESISWHLTEILKPKIPVKRIVFHEITKEALWDAIKNSREIDKKLVESQEARRILDRLVGYTISPLLWKKVSQGLSAGRVQSIAVKLISERELERVRFQKACYWGLEVNFQEKKKVFSATLKLLQSKRIATGKDFNENGKLIKSELLHLNEKKALDLVTSLKQSQFKVKTIEKKPRSRSPKPPFITSTLQQDANRKLRFSAKQTMQIAQKLYENGLITYMRTDSTALSKEALKHIKSTIKKEYGNHYLYPTTRIYKKKSKGAQEAHEAIRPSGSFQPPKKTGLSGQEMKLYTLIWQRSLASQMKNCEQESVSVTIVAGSCVFGTSGTVITFPGFYKAYQDNETMEENPLPELKTNQILKPKSPVKAQEFYTKPPSRYNEASLIQKLEKEGIGRPSTYSPTISTIQGRGYVKKVNHSLAPTFTALAVTNLLTEHLPNYVDLNFTSKMEEALDQIAEGKKKQVQYLKSIYEGKKGLKAEVTDRESAIDGKTSRTLKLKPFKGTLFHVSRFGTYMTKKVNKKEAKADVPNDIFPSDITKEMIDTLFKSRASNGHMIGKDPETKKNIYVKTGRYGAYLELDGGSKRASIPKFMPSENLTIQDASRLMELPKVLGMHPKTKKPIEKKIGPYGPYIVHEGNFRSLPQSKEFFSIGLKEAIALLDQGNNKKSQNSIKNISYEGDEISILNGRYGAYFRFKGKNISIPKTLDPKEITKNDLKSILTKHKAKITKKPNRS